MQLFAVACCRRIWHLLTDERSRRGVEIAERFADGQASKEDRRAGLWAAHEVFMEAKGQERFNSKAPYAPVAMVAFAASSASGMDTEAEAARCAAASLAYRAGAYNSDSWRAAFQAERAVQCDLLREVFGKPFHPVNVDPLWLSWKDGELPKLAQAIYKEGRWSGLPLLADALLAVGCQDEDMLAHCRHQGDHVRGCWVVDALLGKEEPIKLGLTSHQAWTACSDPTPLLAFLKNKATDRKWRLFSVACCRRIGHLITDQRCRNAVEVAEKFADGQTTEEQLALARIATDEVEREAKHAEWCAEAEANFCLTVEYCRICSVLYAVCAARAAVNLKANEPDGGDEEGSWCFAIAALKSAARSAALAMPGKGTSKDIAEAASVAESQIQSIIIQDIFGHLIGPLTKISAWLPYRDGTSRWSLLPSERVISLDPSWLLWADGVVVKLASGIYEEQAFHRLPILADALLDAGCNNEDIIIHCRQTGLHHRGCWVLDLILSKEPGGRKQETGRKQGGQFTEVFVNKSFKE